jgi:hypothetical protein
MKDLGLGRKPVVVEGVGIHTANLESMTPVERTTRQVAGTAVVWQASVAQG